MSNKKILMSVTATAAIASAFIATDSAEAASYKVQSGDTLWSIAQKSGMSVTLLKTANNLTGDTIYVNQVLETETGSAGTVTPAKPATPPKQNAKTDNQSSGSSTYTVKPGDSLSAIATRHNISLTNLMKWNNLNTTLIFPGNVFTVSASGSGGGGSSSGSTESAPAPTPKPENTSGAAYVVKSGDTLTAIASRNGVSVANLKSWNNLSSDLIRIGQKLSTGAAGAVTPNPGNNGTGNVSEKPAADTGYNINNLISSAKAVQGTKYVWGGQSTSGFDCSGFIHYAYNQAGMSMGRTNTEGYYNRSYSVSTPQVGDLVFFKNTYKSGISHMGIYIGNNEFIHAGTSTGVTVTNLNNSYWKKHYDGFKRFY